MIPKTANKQLKTKEFVNEVIDKKEAKIPKAAKKEPSNEDTEAQSQKPSSKTRIFLGTIFLVFLGIAATSTVAYFSYQDGRQNGMISMLKVAKARAKVKYYRPSSNGFDYEDYYYIEAKEYPQVDIVDDIMAIAKKYEEECKSSELSKYYSWNTYVVTNDCIEKLKEKHYLVSYPYNSDKPWYTYLQL